MLLIRGLLMGYPVNLELMSTLENNHKTLHTRLTLQYPQINFKYCFFMVRKSNLIKQHTDSHIDC